MRASFAVRRRNGKKVRSRVTFIYIGRNHREIGEGKGGVGGIGRGVISNIYTTGGNTRREWGNLQKKTNGICMYLPLRSSRKKISGPMNLAYKRWRW